MELFKHISRKYRPKCKCIKLELNSLNVLHLSSCVSSETGLKQASGDALFSEWWITNNLKARYEITASENVGKKYFSLNVSIDWRPWPFPRDDECPTSINHTGCLISLPHSYTKKQEDRNDPPIQSFSIYVRCSCFPTETYTASLRLLPAFQRQAMRRRTVTSLSPQNQE